MRLVRDDEERVAHKRDKQDKTLKQLSSDQLGKTSFSPVKILRQIADQDDAVSSGEDLSLDLLRIAAGRSGADLLEGAEAPVDQRRAVDRRLHDRVRVEDQQLGAWAGHLAVYDLLFLGF